MNVITVPICKCTYFCERNCTVFDSHCWKMWSPYIDVKFSQTCFNSVLCSVTCRSIMNPTYFWIEGDGGTSERRPLGRQGSGGVVLELFNSTNCCLRVSSLGATGKIWSAQKSGLSHSSSTLPRAWLCRTTHALQNKEYRNTGLLSEGKDLMHRLAPVK